MGPDGAGQGVNSRFLAGEGGTDARPLSRSMAQHRTAIDDHSLGSALPNGKVNS